MAVLGGTVPTWGPLGPVCASEAAPGAWDTSCSLQPMRWARCVGGCGLPHGLCPSESPSATPTVVHWLKVLLSTLEPLSS